MINLFPVNSISPGAHVNTLTGPPKLSQPGDSKGADKGAGIGGTHRPTDASGADKGGLTVLPTIMNNPTHAAVNDKFARSALATNQAPADPKGLANKKDSEVPRYWVVDQNELEKSRELMESSLYPMNVHEIHIVEKPTSEMEEQGNQYYSFDDFEKEPEKKEEEETGVESIQEMDEIMIDEAYSWSGHMLEYHYSPETLHTNSISLVTSLLPFRVPISNQ